jgi:hypothetical protein
MLVTIMLPKKEATDPDHALFTNLVISNVPGPKDRLYLHGAEMDGMYPASVLAGDNLLNITVLGYHEHLYFGLIGCPDGLPHVQRVAAALPAALSELERSFGLARRTVRRIAAKTKAAARKPRRRAAAAA